MSIIRASAYTLTAQLLGAASTAVLGIFVARHLGAAGFGEYALALAFTMLLAPVADLGVSLAAARALATTSDRAARSRIYANSAILKLGTAVLFGVVVYALAGLIASGYGNRGLTPVFHAAAFALVGQSLLTFFWSTLIAERRGLLNLGIVAVRVAVEMSLTIIVLLSGHGAAAATLARGIAHVTAAAIGFGVVFGASRSRVRPSIGEGLQMARSALGLAMVEISYGALFQIDVLMIGVFMTPAAVGLYQAPLRILTPVTYLGIALASGLAPVVAREPDKSRQRRQVAGVLCAIAFAEAGIAAVIFARADDVMMLFGRDFGASVHVLRLLSPYIFVAGLGPVASLLVTYLGSVRLRMVIATSALALNLALDIGLIPRFGLTGAAIAADIAAVYYVGSHCWLVARTLELRPSLLVGLVGRAASIASVIAVILFFGRRGVFADSPAWAIGGGLLGLAVLLYAFWVIAPRQVDKLAFSGGRQ